MKALNRKILPYLCLGILSCTLDSGNCAEAAAGAGASWHEDTFAADMAAASAKTFEIAGSTDKIKCTLFSPALKSPNGTIIIVPGTGSFTFASQAPAVELYKRVIGSGLRSGWRVLWYEHRDSYVDTYSYLKRSLDERASELDSIVRSLLALPAASPEGERLVLCGQSEGALVATKLSIARNRSIAGFVWISPHFYADSETLVTQYQDGFDHIDDQGTREYVRETSLIVCSQASEREKIDGIKKAFQKKFPAPQDSAINLRRYRTDMTFSLMVLLSPWMKGFLQEKALLADINPGIPVLLIFGSADRQIDPRKQLEHLKAANSALADRASIVTIDDADHFLRDQSGAFSARMHEELGVWLADRCR